MTAPVVWHGEVEFARASWDDQNGNSVKFWIVESKEHPLTENPFKQHTRRRSGFAGTQFQISVVTIEPLGVEPRPIYVGESMLADWGDTRSGQYVTLWLPEGEHPFAGMTRRARGQAGTRFMAAFCELDDDGTIIDPKLRERIEKPRQDLSQYAAMLCKEPEFLAFLEVHVPTTKEEGFTWNPTTAAEWMRQTCQVPSRALLDTDPDAAKRFHQLVRMPYLQHTGGTW
jgi:hypothetical protein